ncbi:MAG: ATP-grasp domain-containing protein [Alphaproteobacteria bacterium]|nr:ATP-grasp domain-containing protein [Alphaproteobacteria bacterium]
MKKKTLLIVSGGVQATHGIKRAKDFGCHVVVSDLNPNAPGFALADDRLIASTYDPAETLAAAERYHRTVRPIDGVITIGCDAPLTVATVAERLRLPGIPVEAARLAQDKLAMKRRFAEAGVPVPWFTALADAHQLAAIIKRRGHDLVVKPVDSRGSRGVQRLKGGMDLEAVWKRAAAQSPTRRVMVEEYLRGPQISTESILIDGEGFTPGFSDRNYEYLERYAPYFIENGGDLPSHLDHRTQDAVRRTAEAAGRALGITTGNIKGDIVVVDGKPYVIELAARASGGYFCTREIPLNTGVDFIGAVIKIALGEHLDPNELIPKRLTPIVQRYAFPEPGRVTRVAGLEDARRVPGIEELIVTVAPGDEISTPTHSGCTAAMVLATGNNIAAARSAAAAALAALRIETARA